MGEVAPVIRTLRCSVKVYCDVSTELSENETLWRNRSLQQPRPGRQTHRHCPIHGGDPQLVPAAEYAGDPRATAIAEAARRLVALRERWLNPPEWAADTS